MKNYNAEKINDRLGFKIFDESDIHRLRILKYTKKIIKQNSLDDLINEKGQGTERLAKFVKEILF